MMSSVSRGRMFFVSGSRLFCSQGSFPPPPPYSSPMAISKLYPNAKSPYSSPSPPSSDDGSSFTGFIPMKRLTIAYARSGGPGGQHMQKTNTKVNVSFHLESAEWIPKEARIKLAELHKNNINKEGFMSVKSEKTRSQVINLADCLDKLRCYIEEAARPLPVPSAESIETKRDFAKKAAASRLRDKRLHSMRKTSQSVDL